MSSKEELSLGNLVQNQSKLGYKVRNKINSQKQEQPKKRANKNRPREQSSKISVREYCSEVKKKAFQPRDPRFDNLCGEYNEKFFRDTYSFLDNIKQREKNDLKKKFFLEKDASKKAQIKFLLKRIEDQERENERKWHKEKKKEIEREKLTKNLLEGKSAHFKTKSEKKLSELVDKYEELKATGKIQSYIKKKQKKIKKQKKPFDTMPFN